MKIIKTTLREEGRFEEINIIPIDERLGRIDSSHKSIIAILGKIESNVVQSRHLKPWKAPRWKTAKIIAQHVEEIGLLARLNKENAVASTKEAVCLIDELMAYYQDGNLEKETGDYYELFLSETAIALIYGLEYFSDFLSSKQQRVLSKNLHFISDTLWDLILNSQVYDKRSRSRLAWNHSQFVHAISGICAIKLNNEQSEERIERSILWIEGYLSHSFTWDGFSREGIFYAGVTRMPLLLFMMALKKYKSIDLFHHASLINHFQYLMNEWIPNSEKFITRNDINHLNYSTTLSSLLLYANIYQCEKTLALWEAIVGEAGDQTFGNPSSESNRNGSLVLNYLFYPARLSSSIPLDSYIDSFKVYREAGVVVGFSKQSSFKYSFQASSHYGAIHSQSDHGQIYLYLNGETLLGDTSVGNSRELNTPGQSEGHNTLLIDNEGMSLSGAGWQTCSILEDATCHGNYHSMRANLTPAFNAYDSRATLAQYRRLVIVHNKEPYHIVILDSVSDYHDIEHEYAYRFHTDPNHNISHKQGAIEIEATHSMLNIIPLGLDWKPQEQKSFLFKNDVRSTFIDNLFSTKDYLGGYILVPSSKNTPVKITKQNEEVILSTETHESSVFLNPTDINNCLLSCHTTKKLGESLKNGIYINQDSSNSDSSLDRLTGSIVEFL